MLQALYLADFHVPSVGTTADAISLLLDSVRQLSTLDFDVGGVAISHLLLTVLYQLLVDGAQVMKELVAG